MNTLKIVGISIAVSLVVGVILLMTLGGSTGESIVREVRNVGAVASPDIQSPYFSFGGVRFWGGKTESLTAATTTVCAIQSPAATSTLVNASIYFNVSSTTASVVTLAKSATAFATTTSLGTLGLAANAQGGAVATTTSAQVWGPNQWFVVGMQGGPSGQTFSPTGTCQATWMQLATI